MPASAPKAIIRLVLLAVIVRGGLLRPEGRTLLVLLRLVRLLRVCSTAARPGGLRREVAAEHDKVVGLRVVVCQVVVLAKEANQLGRRAVISQNVWLDALVLQHKLKKLLPNTGPAQWCESCLLELTEACAGLWGLVGMGFPPRAAPRECSKGKEARIDMISAEATLSLGR